MSGVPQERVRNLDEAVFTAEPSFPQQVLWMLGQLEDGAPTYNIQIGLRFRGALDERALSRALDEVVARHEVLRTNLRFDDGDLLQVIGPPRPVPCETTDLSGLRSSDGAEAELRRHAGTELLRPFNGGPELPIRASLVRMADDDHALLITMDHLVCDAWSLQVLHNELCTLYVAFSAGEPSPLDELPIQYADYASWQREWLRGPVLRRQLDYWRERLAGDVPRLELPVTGGRGAGRRRTASTRQPLDAGLVARLDAVGRSAGVSLFMVLLGAFMTQLSRYSRQPDVVVGTLLAGRTRAEMEPLIGFFVNTVALRVDLSGNPSLREALRRVRETVLDAYAHQDVPFDQVVADIRPERSAGEQPFFDAMFQFADIDRKTVTAPGIRIEPMPMGSEPAPADLVVAVLREDDGYVCVWDHDAALFNPSTVDRMQAHFLALLHGIADDVGRRIGELDLLAPTERARLTAFAGTAAARGAWPNLTVHNGTALSWHSGELSYAELDGKVNRLARWLRSRGVRSDDIVGLLIDRGERLVVTMLAVWRAGAAFLPLDPNLGDPRIEMILADAAPAMVIASANLRGRAPAGRVPVVLEEIAGEVASLAADAVPALAEPANLAYVIYTSGSTGRPKGVAVTCAGIPVIVAAQRASIGMRPTDCLLQTASPSFDAYVFNVLLALDAGGRLHIPGERFAADIAGVVREHGVTVVNLPPSALNTLPADGNAGPLRLVLVAGEACPPELATAWAVGHRFINQYGPTEATIWSTAHEVTAADSGLATLPIGRPVRGVRAYVLDNDLWLMPIGLPGELYLGGDVIARGYLGSPGLTAAAFLPDPFGDRPGSRLYRTGDMVRWRPDGVLEFLGRVDTQVKLRGYRVELGEIEGVLTRHPAVQEAVVTLSGEGAAARLVAYVIAGPGAEPTERLLRAFCAEALSDYLVPASIVPLPRFPRTATGKVDRQALPAPAPAPVEEAATLDTGPLERAISKVWAEILGRGVGGQDVFFDVGGHSLAAARVVTRLRRDLGLDIPVRIIFDNPRLVDFVRAVSELPPGREGGVVTGPITRQATGPAPLSFGQERMWLMARSGESTPFNNFAFATRLRGRLDMSALERAIAEVHRRHDVLRTIIEVSGDTVRQVPLPAGPVSLDVVDCTGHADPAAEAHSLARELTGRAYRLDAEPPVRWQLYRLGPDDHLLALGVHHIAGDGWSESLLNRELGYLYAAFRTGTAPSLRPPSIRYADYASWQRRRGARGDFAGQLEFWRDRLRDASPAVSLPFDAAPTANTGWAGECMATDLPPDLTRQVNGCASAHGVTPFVVTFAAFAVLLHRYARQDDLVIGVPVAGRVRPELEQLIGFFVNTVALRVDLSGDPPFASLLAGIRGSTVDAFAHQEVPFDLVVAESGVGGEPGRPPLVQVLFQLHNTPEEPLTLDGLEVSQEQIFGRTSTLDISVSLVARANGLRGLWEYRSGLFSRATIARMQREFERLLAGAVADSTRPISQYPPAIEPAGHLAPTGLARAFATSPAGYAEPRTDAEWVLADVWAEVLGVARVGRDDRLAADAAQLNGKVAGLLCRAYPQLSRADLERWLGTGPTLAQLAAFIEAQRTY